MIAGIAQRQQIIDEARTWLRTPWRHASAVRGAGVDCARFLIEVYANCGIIDRFVPSYYPQDFAMHSDDELFLANLELYAHRIKEPLPGDVAVWKFGKCFSHGAIVIEWPEIIHAKMHNGVLLDLGNQGDLMGRAVLFYSVFTS